MIIIGLLILQAATLTLAIGCVFFIEDLTRAVARAWFTEKRSYLAEMTKLGSTSTKFE